MRLILGLDDGKDPAAGLGTQHVVGELGLVTHCLVAEQPQLTRPVHELLIEEAAHPPSSG